MATGILGNRGIYTAAAGVLQNVYTPSTDARLRSIGLYNTHSSATIRVKAYVNTYTYFAINLGPGQGYPIRVGRFVPATVAVAISANLGGSFIYWHVSAIEDVNAGGLPPTLTGLGGYYAPGTPNTLQSIWAPPAGGTQQHRLADLALFNSGASSPIEVTIAINTFNLQKVTLPVDDGVILDDLHHYINSNAPLQIAANVADNLIQWHYTGIVDVNA